MVFLCSRTTMITRFHIQTTGRHVGDTVSGGSVIKTFTCEQYLTVKAEMSLYTGPGTDVIASRSRRLVNVIRMRTKKKKKRVGTPDTWYARTTPVVKTGRRRMGSLFDGFDSTGEGRRGFVKTAKTRFGFPLRRPATPYPPPPIELGEGRPRRKRKTCTKNHFDGDRMAGGGFHANFAQTIAGHGRATVIHTVLSRRGYFDADTDETSARTDHTVLSSRRGGATRGGRSSRALYRSRYSVL